MHLTPMLLDGLRWLVARLSFNLIIGNLHISCELLDVDEREGVAGKLKISGDSSPGSTLDEGNQISATNSLVEKSRFS